MSESDDTMRSDYSDVLKDGVRGKYFKQAMLANGLVEIAPDLREIFPSSEAVNEGLRLLVRTLKSGSGQKQVIKTRVTRPQSGTRITRSKSKDVKV